MLAGAISWGFKSPSPHHFNHCIFISLQLQNFRVTFCDWKCSGCRPKVREHEPVDVVLTAFCPLSIVLAYHRRAVPQDVGDLLECGALFQESGRKRVTVAVFTALSIEPLSRKRTSLSLTRAHAADRKAAAPFWMYASTSAVVGAAQGYFR